MDRRAREDIDDVDVSTIRARARGEMEWERELPNAPRDIMVTFFWHSGSGEDKGGEEDLGEAWEERARHVAEQLRSGAGLDREKLRALMPHDAMARELMASAQQRCQCFWRALPCVASEGGGP